MVWLHFCENKKLYTCIGIQKHRKPWRDTDLSARSITQKRHELGKKSRYVREEATFSSVSFCMIRHINRTTFWQVKNKQTNPSEIAWTVLRLAYLSFFSIINPFTLFSVWKGSGILVGLIAPLFHSGIASTKRERINKGTGNTDPNCPPDHSRCCHRGLRQSKGIKLNQVTRGNQYLIHVKPALTPSILWFATQTIDLFLFWWNMGHSKHFHLYLY